MADFEQSGLSRRDYCSQHQLSVNNLDNWRRKAKAATKFVRVEVTQTRPHGRFTLVLTNGRRIETEAGFDEDELTRLMRGRKRSESVSAMFGLGPATNMIANRLGGSLGYAY